MTLFQSDWSTTTRFRHEAEALLIVNRHVSDNGLSDNTVAKMPGGYLTWVIKNTNGQTQVHACRINQTVNGSVTISDNNDLISRIDTYNPPAEIILPQGVSPFGLSTSVYVDEQKKPKVVCLSNEPRMFMSDDISIEEQPLDIDLIDRPERVIAKRFGGAKKMGVCFKMKNGNVIFSITPETAYMSSSSQSSISSSVSTEYLPSSASSQSTVSPSSSSSSTSSVSSMSSGLCEVWGFIEVVDTAFSDMDGHPGGFGTVGNELRNWVINGLRASNTDVCSRFWCLYIPQGAVGVGGSSIGKVYLYKTFSRPSSLPFTTSSLMGSIDLDSSVLYGIGWPKTLPINAYNDSGIYGSVKWYGGNGHGTLLPGCSSVRLQIPFSLRPEASSLSSISSRSSQSSMSSTITVASASSLSSNPLTLAVEVNLGGTVSLSPPGPYYHMGNIVTATAIATTGYHFKNWYHDASGTNPQIQVLMDRDKVISPVWGRNARAVGWGYNNHNQLPGFVLPAGSNANLTAIDGGDNYSLALLSNGTLVICGVFVLSGGLTYESAYIPAGLNDVVAISAGGSHCLALKSNGSVVAWGLNLHNRATVPSGLGAVTKVSAGMAHSLALKANGTVVAWGYNGSGQTGVPVGLSGVIDIAAGSSHSLALKSDGTVVGWGLYGGIPAGLSNVVAISAGSSASLALKSNGTVVEWGYYGNRVPSGLSGVVAISSGGGSVSATSQGLALKSNGTVVAWGANNYGQSNVPSLSNVIAIGTGQFHSLALTES